MNSPLLSSSQRCSGDPCRQRPPIYQGPAIRQRFTHNLALSIQNALDQLAAAQRGCLDDRLVR